MLRRLYSLAQPLAVWLAASGCGVHDVAALLQSAPEGVDFILGSDGDPELLPPGPGAGEWASERPTALNRLLAASAKDFLATAAARDRYGDEAAGTFHHYFENTGADFQVDLQKLAADVPRIGDLMLRALSSAQRFGREIDSEAWPVAFTSRQALTAIITREDSENWYLAINGFSYFVKGRLNAEGELTVEFHLWDRYDWDPGVVVPIDTPFGTVPVDQERVGEFHRQGLAKEFDTRGRLVVFGF